MASRPWTERLRAFDSRWFDAVLTLGLTGLGVGSLFMESPTNDHLYRDTDVLAVSLGFATTLPVFWRRQRPFEMLLISTIAITILSAAEYRTNNLPNAVLFLAFAVSAYAPRRQAVLGLVTVNTAIWVILFAGSPDLDGTNTLLNSALFSAAWLGGLVVNTRAQTTAAQLAEAEERTESQRQLVARSVAEERLRLAQELHDVVAHSMSVIAVQAGMGVHVIDSQPDQAKQALEAISHTSRNTLNEMRRLLGVLRDEDGERSHAPAPDISELPRLVADVRNTGLVVDLTVVGDTSAVPHGVELSVYRLVQEGLTNVIKHAGEATAAVTVRCTPTQVEVEVVDDGRGAATNGQSLGGHGLVGMRERVALWGGTLDVGPRQGGGYRVFAQLPYGEAT